MERRLTEAQRLNAVTIWAGAAAVAGLGAWIMFDAFPGVNWVLWTSASVIGLRFVLAGASGRIVPVPTATAILAIIVAGAAALTADPLMHAVIFFSVSLLLALTMLLAVDPRLERISAWFVITAPILAGARAMVESLTRAIEASQIVKSDRARSAVRGIAITVPVIVFFALLLSAADPVFAAWREAVVRLLSSWEFIPRTIFFFVLLTIVLGAYGYVARTKAGDSADDWTAGDAGRDRTRWLGATERIILLASVGALFWMFLAVQLSYLFGNLPATIGSGVTFAEYARRGFGELTIVATSTVLLILLSERYGQKSDRDGLLRAITLAVIAAVLILLGSAFNRVSLYEAAYGFTTARLYAQVYMFVIAVTLAVLAVETRREMNPSRVFRRAGLVAVVAFIVMIYWNHESWIARENIQRFATTGKLDVVYLTRDLSPNAIPAIVAELASLPDPVRSQLRTALSQRYEGRGQLLPQRWFEWNRGRAAARRELLRIGVSLDPPVVPKPVPIATR